MAEHPIGKFAKVYESFWTGRTGLQMRASRNVEAAKNARVVALYLTTCPTADMTGIHRVSLPEMCHTIPIAEPDARAALTTLEQIGFCLYDEQAELCFVREFARYQIAETLIPSDWKRRKGIENRLAKFHGHRFVRLFLDRYKERFHLGEITAPEMAEMLTEHGIGKTIERVSEPLPNPSDTNSNSTCISNSNYKESISPAATLAVEPPAKKRSHKAKPRVGGLPFGEALRQAKALLERAYSSRDELLGWANARDYSNLSRIMETLRTTPDPMAEWQRTIDAFFADEWARQRGWQITILWSQWAGYRNKSVSTPVPVRRAFTSYDQYRAEATTSDGGSSDAAQ